MRKNKLYVIIIIIMVCSGFSLWSIQGTATRSIFEVSIDDYHLTAGIRNVRNIDVTNIGDSAKDVEAQLTSNTPFITVLEGFSSFLRDIDKDETEFFSTTLSVSKETPLGSYTLSLVIAYENDIGSLLVANYVLGVIVDSIEEVRINFNVSFLNNELIAGTQNLVKLNIRNLSPYRINNFETQLISQTPYIVILEGSYQYFQSIDPETSINMTTLLAVSRNTPLGPYNFVINLQYDYNAEIMSSSYSLGCIVNSSIPNKIQIVLITCKQDELFLTLENLASETLKNIFVSLTNNGVLIGSPYEIQINEMASNKETIIIFQLTEDVLSAEITIRYDGIIETSILYIPTESDGIHEISCFYPARKSVIGSTIIYELIIKNRGNEGFYYLHLQGLPNSINSRFIADSTEITGLYMEKAQESIVFLEITLPHFPREFVIDDSIIFQVMVVDATLYTQLVIEQPNNWLPYSTGALELIIIPTIQDILPIGGKSGKNELATPTNEIHYPGIPYSIENLVVGSYVTVKFELNGETSYIFSLYGNYVGKDTDLNLNAYNASGSLLNASSSSRGNSDTIEVFIPSTGIYLIVISNDEGISQGFGSGIIVATEKWNLDLNSNSIIQLNEGHYSNFLIGEVRAFNVDVSKFQGQDLTLLLEWNPELKSDIRIYPFTRNSQKEDYDPISPTFKYNTTLSINNPLQQMEMVYTIARDAESLLIVFTKVQGTGEVLISTNLSNPLVDFISYRRYRTELISITIILSIIGLFGLAYYGEKYLR